MAPDKATVNIKTTIDNQSAADAPVSLSVKLTPVGTAKGGSYADAPRAAPAPQTVPAGKSLEISGTYTLPNPAIWNLDTPNLYHATVNVLSNGKTIDSQTVTFGVRQFEFKSDTGFWLNGKNFKLLGGAVHSEGGAFGVAVPDSVWERRLAILKTLGVNAIRTAHNPPSPEFLDICDRQGLLVMDEMFDVWTVRKYQDQDYSTYFRDWWRPDTTDTLRRDRNHPSVVIWSMGNEIHDNLASAQGKQQFTDMRDLAHQLDTTRPVTMAILQPLQHNIFSSGFSDLMDVVGVNYHEMDLLNEHKARPDYKILGTENHYELSTWLALRDNPAYSGQFLWTGIDYLGEAGAWPRIGNGSGLIDRDSVIKPLGYQRQSWWSTKPMVYITRSGAAAAADAAAEAVAGVVARRLALRRTKPPTRLRPQPPMPMAAPSLFIAIASRSNSSSMANRSAPSPSPPTTRLESGPPPPATSRPSAPTMANPSPPMNCAPPAPPPSSPWPLIPVKQSFRMITTMLPPFR